MKRLSAEDINKINMGVRVLRKSLDPFGLDIEVVCRAREPSPTHEGLWIPYRCDVIEPYGWAPEAGCPLHD